MVDVKIIEAVNAMREACKLSDDKRDSGLPHDIPEVIRYDDLKYGEYPKWNLLDLYLPKNVSGNIPVIINIHGGGWVYGTKETYQYYGLGMAKRGFAFVNPNYKLAPDVQFPGELDQVDQYIHWVADHADEYNLDKNNVFIIGDSAGGQMAEQYAVVLTNKEYREKIGYKLTDLKIRAIALNCPATFVLDPGMISGAVSAYFTHEILNDPNLKDLLNVEKYITKDFLPTFIATANQDFARDCSIRLDGYLRAKEVEVIQKSWGDLENPRAHVFMINQRDELADLANDEEAKFFKDHMS